MKIIIAGSRDLEIEQEYLIEIINKYSLNITEIVSGNCHSGIDKVGEKYANSNNIILKIFPADWSVGKSAGPKRNKKMAEYADIALVIMKKNKETPGSLNMIQEMKKLNKVCIVEYVE